MPNVNLPVTKVHDFNKALAFSIDAVLSETIGQEMYKLIRHQLLSHYSIDQDKLPYNIEILHRVLEDILGLTQAKTLGKRIAKKLYAELDLPFTDYPTHDLVQYVEEAKNLLLPRPDKASNELVALGFTPDQAERWLEKHPGFSLSKAEGLDRLELSLYRLWLNYIKPPKT